MLQEASMKFRRVLPKSLFSLLIKRLVILLFIMNFVLILLFGIGNYQGFLPDTQLFLLTLTMYCSILLVLASLGAFIYSAFKKRKGIKVYLGYSLITFFGSLLSLLIAFLIQVTQGNM